MAQHSRRDADALLELHGPQLAEWCVEHGPLAVAYALDRAKQKDAHNKGHKGKALAYVGGVLRAMKGGPPDWWMDKHAPKTANKDKWGGLRLFKKGEGMHG